MFEYLIWYAITIMVAFGVGLSMQAARSGLLWERVETDGYLITKPDVEMVHNIL